MKSDLDAYMAANQLDALWVTGPAMHNPPMVYLTGGGHISVADLIKKRGVPPVLFYADMERGEAAKTGLQLHPYSKYPFAGLLKEANGNFFEAEVLRYQHMLSDLGITRGRVAVYGRTDVGRVLATVSRLQEHLPEIQFVGDPEEKVFLQAMMTKDASEVERIRKMGKITTEVVGEVADFLSSREVQGDVLVQSDGMPLTIGDVKRMIGLWLAERGAENPEDTIFAIGRDSGMPHSSGTPTDLLRLGQTIVFDIYPCEAGGGYFYDFTRTWCLGYASDQALALHEQVLTVFEQIRKDLKVGANSASYQSRACKLFETMGHPTVHSQPATTEGYVHGLGHGVGLNIHERPLLGSNSSNSDTLQPGMVFTVEPGLYYPEQGLGVRLEDTFWATDDGKFEILADYPKDLVLPVRGS